jgi:hypothetical protein
MREEEIPIMKLINKAVLAAGAFAAVAVPVGVAASSASAATVAPAAVMSYRAPAPDQLKLTYQGNTYTYNVQLREQWVAPGVEVISGHLTDTYEPQAISLPVHGVQFGNDAVFSVQYPATGPDAGSQGVRTFSGVVGPHGATSGNWSETGSEAGSGPFTLARI